MDGDMTYTYKLGLVVGVIIGISFGVGGMMVANGGLADFDTDDDSVPAKIVSVSVDSGSRSLVVDVTKSVKRVGVGVDQSGSILNLHREVVRGPNFLVSFPLNWSSYGDRCGYAVDGPTVVYVVNESGQITDLVEVDITKQTDICDWYNPVSKAVYMI